MLFGDNLLDFDDPKAKTAQARTDLINEKKKSSDANILFSQIQCTVVGNRRYITMIIVNL